MRENEGLLACWICCETSTEAHEPLLSTGCACRGTSGAAHIRCLVRCAGHDVERWTSCPTCSQRFTGVAEVALARARWAGVCDRPPEDPERLFVASNYAVTLHESGSDRAGVLLLLEHVLAVRRRTLGSSDPDTLDSITNLALYHVEVGNHEAALALSEEVVSAKASVWWLTSCVHPA